MNAIFKVAHEKLGIRNALGTPSPFRQVILQPIFQKETESDVILLRTLILGTNNAHCATAWNYLIQDIPS